MSDPFPKQRTYPGEVDLRGRAAPAEKLDPLAELARLVGREDPFRDLFPTRKAGAADRSTDVSRLPAPDAFDRFGGSTSEPQTNRVTSNYIAGETPDERAGIDGSQDDEGSFHAPLGRNERASFRLPALRDEDHGFGGDGHSVEHASDLDGPLNADLWAQGMPEPVSGDPLRFVPPVEDAGESIQASRRRTFVVLAAVVALAAGGLGATFMLRGGGTASVAGEPPTILAETGPAKIQPPDTSNQATGGDGNTALLEKSASDNVSNAKVVDTQERPVDLAQLPQAPPATAAQPDDGRVAVATAPTGTNANTFPEPRRVKTIMIRPDGSVVGESALNASDEQSTLGAPAQAPAANGTAPRPTTPKSTARATATPKAPAADGTSAKPKLVRATPKPKPVQTVDATAGPDTTASTAPAPSGAFAVQLAAPATEQDAKDVMSRLEKKYSAELDGRKPSIHKADKGDKSVFRVRVSNLSQDDAKTLCSKLQVGGGSCFVVHN